jgi:hypothetical protein
MSDSFQNELENHARVLEEMKTSLSEREFYLNAREKQLFGCCLAPTDIVEIDIGGTKFTTTCSVLIRERTLFGVLFSTPYSAKKDKEGCYFFDRDPSAFRYLLNHLRDPACLPSNLSSRTREQLIDDCKL